ncbi:biotin--[acetyl-CoA-carboxylase] ligase [Streptomonospora salina]|uniref:biotin--[biotin carboxyl-carrier protein] ligase n=1 Tax=Streptomonospora salina TaxID=104205 RepID=A0A841E8M2_9ACTN|nr:biotin--[acetyl-CoA-carboxylase] ligase [Streptomonospora salina]MBB5999346.1 BirA family biotin operon repressor/biotin-[acetyl-CoA-carboxylase] ligase [Streptomonospora salina]
MSTPAAAASGGAPDAGGHRPPLDGPALERALVRPGGLWRSVDVRSETASTNSALLDRARGGAPGGTVLAADLQTAGRGRLDRGFDAPPRAALTVSALVRPGVAPPRLGWLPLLMGVAAVRALRSGPDVPAVLKWPNDLLERSSELKLAGILSEAAFPGDPDAAGGGAGNAGVGVVIGIGLNVSQRRGELPVDTASSLALCGAPGADRQELCAELLKEFAALYTAWADAGGDAEAAGLAGEYHACCATLGRRVLAHLPGGRELRGRAARVDADGRLAVHDDAGAEHTLSAGDVVHLRPDGG